MFEVLLGWNNPRILAGTWLRIFYQNIQGLTTEKYTDYIQSIQSEQFEFICITETWLKSSETNQFHALNYHIINKPRTYIHPQARRGSGGLLLFIHKRIWENVEILNSTDMEDRIWIKLQNKQKYIFICFCYMPPQGSTISCNRTSEWGSLEREIVKFSLDGDLIICGDLNARTGTMCDYIESDSEMPQNSPLTYIVYQDYPRVSQDLSVNTQGRCLLDLCIGSRLHIL